MKALFMAPMGFVVCGVVTVGGVTGLAGASAESGSVEQATGGVGGGIASSAPVPGWVRKLVAKVAGECPEISPSFLAAQLHQESNFNPKAVSPANAAGIAQFIPPTWSQYGKDGDGDGRKDVMNPRDAIPAQAAYDCALAQEVKNVPGNGTSNMLAAYNAGPAAVLKYMGIPPYAETQKYVKLIRAQAARWEAAEATPKSVPKGKVGRVVNAARSALGTWYRWGGTCVKQYWGEKGCDCSSLTQMAWRAAGVNLPRTTYEQVKVGSAVRGVAGLRPGDLLFSRGSAKRPEHVGMYLGGQRVIDAPRTGAKVRIKPLSAWTSQVLAIRHIG
ncbi:NlpC/P60 family protein [Streptomyces sp. NPDC048172]|uniref:bifunctional lytic transglycosylase/C40 family peptidase n=1 Tax=Streptomyces sp. NPDC048172 TaxID=3365505 RepID=UPI003718E2E8